MQKNIPPNEETIPEEINYSEQNVPRMMRYMIEVSHACRSDY